MKRDSRSGKTSSAAGDNGHVTAAREAVCYPAASGEAAQDPDEGRELHRSGCTVCGADLVYSATDRDSTCHYCRKTLPANARCANGHFVCDSCHSADAVEIIKSVCIHSLETDPVMLMRTIRSHPHFRMHGPEHHAMVPAVVLTALRNSGCPITYQEFTTAIQRGRTIAGGSCAFLGACGAAIGVGIGISLLLGATPYDGARRQSAQQATQSVLGAIASLDAPRCCQRDCWLALREASRLVREYAGIPLTASSFACEQYSGNRECIRERCPLWPSNHAPLL